MAWAQGQSGRVSLRHPYAHAYAVLTRIFASSSKIWDFLVGSLLSTCFTLSGLCHFPTTCHNMTCAGPTPGTSRQFFFSPSDLHTPGNQNGLSCSHVFKLQSGAFHLPQVDIFTRAMFPKPALSLQLFPFWVLQGGCFFFLCYTPKSQLIQSSWFIKENPCRNSAGHKTISKFTMIHSRGPSSYPAIGIPPILLYISHCILCCKETNTREQRNPQI